MSVVTPDQVIEALRPVQDPELHRSIVDLNMVRDVSINDGVVALTVTLTIAGCPLRNEIQNRVNGAIRPLPGVRDVQLNFGVMTDDERAALREKLHGSPAASAGSAPAQGHAQGRTISFAQPGSKTRPLLISSMTESLKSKLTCLPFLFRLGCFFCLFMLTKGLLNFWSTYFRTLRPAALCITPAYNACRRTNLINNY